MSPKISKELAKHRLQQAKEDLGDAELLFNNKRLLAANNRAYYSIFHAIRSVLALEAIDFKKHKNVLAYFNENYVNKEIFPKSIGRKIARASKTREDSDYDDDFTADEDQTARQIQTARELIKLVEKFINEVNNEEE